MVDYRDIQVAGLSSVIDVQFEQIVDTKLISSEILRPDIWRDLIKHNLKTEPSFTLGIKFAPKRLKLRKSGLTFKLLTMKKHLEPRMLARLSSRASVVLGSDMCGQQPSD